MGLDLPLKALVYEDADGRTWLVYNASDYILARHGAPQEHAANIAGASRPIEQAARGD